MDTIVDRLRRVSGMTSDWNSWLAQEVANYADEAVTEIDRLRAELAEEKERNQEYAEFVSECVSDKLDPSVGVGWMRCSPDLPKYVQGLEAVNARLVEAGDALAMAASILCGNAQLIDDPRMRGMTECYAVPLEDQENLHYPLAQWRQAIAEAKP